MGALAPPLPPNPPIPGFVATAQPPNPTTGIIVEDFVFVEFSVDAEFTEQDADMMCWCCCCWSNLLSIAAADAAPAEVPGGAATGMRVGALRLVPPTPRVKDIGRRPPPTPTPTKGMILLLLFAMMIHLLFLLLPTLPSVVAFFVFSWL